MLLRPSKNRRILSFCFDRFADLALLVVGTELFRLLVTPEAVSLL